MFVLEAPGSHAGEEDRTEVELWESSLTIKEDLEISVVA